MECKRKRDDDDAVRMLMGRETYLGTVIVEKHDTWRRDTIAIVNIIEVM